MYIYIVFASNYKKTLNNLRFFFCYLSMLEHKNIFNVVSHSPLENFTQIKVKKKNKKKQKKVAVLNF